MCYEWEEERLWHDEEEEDDKVPVDIGRLDIVKEPAEIQESTVPEAA